MWYSGIVVRGGVVSIYECMSDDGLWMQGRSDK